MAKKISKKFVGEFLTATTGDCNWCVFTFNKETGVRESAYGGYNFMQAFCEITKELARGKYDVLMTNKEGWEFHANYEAAGGFEGIRYAKRVTRELMKPYAVYVDGYLMQIKKADFMF